MLSEEILELKALQYLDILEKKHEQKKLKLKELQDKVNYAASRIQSAWKLYWKTKMHRNARLIQKNWKIYKQRKLQQDYIIQKFKHAYYEGIISLFVYKKYFLKKKQRNKQVKNNLIQIQLSKKKSLSNNYTSFSTIIPRIFSEYIHLYSAYHSQSEYLKKLRQHQRQKFEQSWQKYEQNLNKQMLKQANKKWIHSAENKFINKQDKQIDFQQYAQKHVSRIFKREYQKYKQQDKKLQNSHKTLDLQINLLKEKYYFKLLRVNNKSTKM